MVHESPRPTLSKRSNTAQVDVERRSNLTIRCAHPHALQFAAQQLTKPVVGFGVEPLFIGISPHKVKATARVANQSCSTAGCRLSTKTTPLLKVTLSTPSAVAISRSIQFLQLRLNLLEGFIDTFIVLWRCRHSVSFSWAQVRCRAETIADKDLESRT